jgi:hypothetical protein
MGAGSGIVRPVISAAFNLDRALGARITRIW